MKKNWNKKRIIITTVICLVPILYGLILYRTLPDQVPTHWNFRGEIDGYSSKNMAVFGIPAFMALINLICQFALATDPKKEGHPRQLREVVSWMIPILSIVVTTMMLMAAQGKAVAVSKIMPILIGIIFVIIGNYLPKCHQNYTMGIKLPWTLASVENWNRTHRMAGPLWMLGGIIIILSALLDAPAVLFAVILVLALLPTVYSYYLYRKGI